MRREDIAERFGSPEEELKEPECAWRTPPLSLVSPGTLLLGNGVDPPFEEVRVIQITSEREPTGLGTIFAVDVEFLARLPQPGETAAFRIPSGVTISLGYIDQVECPLVKTTDGVRLKLVRPDIVTMDGDVITLEVLREAVEALPKTWKCARCAIED